MAVVFDAKSTQFTTDSGTLLSDTSLTVGTGSNRALLVLISRSGNDPTLTCTWGGTTLTQVASSVNGFDEITEIWGLLNPASGAQVLAITWLNNQAACASGISFTGVEPSSLAAALTGVQNNTGATGPATCTIPSAVGDIVVACQASLFCTLTEDHISIYNFHSLSGTGLSANRAAGAASVTLAATQSVAQTWAASGINVHAAAETVTGGGTPTDGGTRFRRTIYHQTIAQPVVFTATATPYAGWDDTLEWPQRARPQSTAYSAPFLAQTLGVFQVRDNPNGEWANWPDFVPGRPRLSLHQPWSFVPPPAQVFFPYAPWDDFAGRKAQPINTQPLSYVSVVVQAAQQVWYPADRWPDWFPAKRIAVDPLSETFVGLVPDANVIGDWPDFVRRKPPPINTNPLIWAAQPIAVQQVWFPYDPWPSLIAKKPVPLNFTPATPFIQTPVQVFFPYGPWDDFARRQRPAIDTQRFASSNFTPPPNFFLVPDRWPDYIRGKSVPLNFDPLALVQPVPQVWFPYGPWDDFTRRKWQQIDTQPLIWTSQTIAAAQVWFPYDPWPSFIPRKAAPLNYVPLALGLKVIPSWTQWTRWPDKIWRKPQPVDTGPPTVLLQLVRTPWNELSRWPELVPIRGMAGLHAALQQVQARFPGLITQATITGIISAFEQNTDVAAIAIFVGQSQPAVRAAVSIQEIGTI